MLRSQTPPSESWFPEVREKLRMDSKKRFMLLLLFFNAMLIVILLLSVRNQEILREIQRVEIQIQRYAERLATIEATVLKIVYITATPPPPTAVWTSTQLPPTATDTRAPPPTFTAVPTRQPTNAPTFTREPPSPTPSVTPIVPTSTPTPTWTPTPTSSPTPTQTPTPTWTPTPETPTPMPRPTTIILTALPTVITADGSSTVSIRAQVLDQNGAPVPDDTQVTFTVDLGAFWGSQNVVVVTVGGIAEVTLTASTSAGRATVTATSDGALGNVSIRFKPWVRISKGVNLSAAPTGSTLTYRIVVRNASTGGEAAALRALHDTLPAGFSYVPGSTSSVPASAFGSDPAVAGQNLKWTPSPVPYDLAPGSSVEVVFQVAAQAPPGTYPNSASVDGGNFDTASTGETAHVTLQGPTPVSVTPAQRCNDVPVDVTIEGFNFAPGATAKLGGWALLNVTWVNENMLTASVPQDIVIGSYDLTVTNPDGSSGTLGGAYTALDCSSIDTTLDSGYLGTYGAEPGYAPDQGDDDQVQVLFLEVPAGTSDPLFVRVFDPDCGGELDRQSGLAWDTPFTYTVYGRSGAYTPDVSSGQVLTTAVFTEDASVDDEWYSFGPLNPADGDLASGKRIFKLAVIGGPEPPFTAGINFADLNLYNVALSTSPVANTAPSGARIFAFSWTFLIPEVTYDAPPRMFPYVDSRVITFTQHNWDYDNLGGMAGITITTPIRTIAVPAAYVSGDGEERSSDYVLLEGERDTTWAINCWVQPVGGIGDNLVTFWATDQNGDRLAIFARSTTDPPP